MFIFLFYIILFLHTLVDDSVFLGYPGDVGIRGSAEIAG